MKFKIKYSLYRDSKSHKYNAILSFSFKLESIFSFPNYYMAVFLKTPKLKGIVSFFH